MVVLSILDTFFKYENLQIASKGVIYIGFTSLVLDIHGGIYLGFMWPLNRVQTYFEFKALPFVLSI